MQHWRRLTLLTLVFLPSVVGAISVQVSEIDNGSIECSIINSSDELPTAIAISISCSGIEFNGLNFSHDRTLLGVKLAGDHLVILVASMDFEQPISYISDVDGLLARVIIDQLAEDWVLGIPQIEVITSGDSEIDFAFQLEGEPSEPGSRSINGQLSIYPNPGNAHFVISYIGNSERIRGHIFDVSGARVRSFEEISFSGTEKCLFEWDGRDTNGHELSSGVYFVSVKDDLGHRLTERFVLLK